jgi:hypothetical protein
MFHNAHEMRSPYPATVKAKGASRRAVAVSEVYLATGAPPKRHPHWLNRRAIGLAGWERLDVLPAVDDSGARTAGPGSVRSEGKGE